MQPSIEKDRSEKVIIPKEPQERERRVALSPDVVSTLVKAGFECLVEKEAGIQSYFQDKAYETAGAQMVSDRKDLYGQADVVLKVNAPSEEEISVGTNLIFHPF